MLRTVRSLPLHRAFDAGLRPDPFPDRAASLLPGLLAATRTGLAPAGDDELTNLGHLHEVTSVPLGARKARARGGPPDCRLSVVTVRSVPISHDRARLALVGLRFGLATGSWLAPGFTGRVFGLQPDINPVSPYLA